jgi:hypothetical protein
VLLYVSNFIKPTKLFHLLSSRKERVPRTGTYAVLFSFCSEHVAFLPCSGTAGLLESVVLSASFTIALPRSAGLVELCMVYLMYVLLYCFRKIGD